jgi:hypothetical protein
LYQILATGHNIPYPRKRGKRVIALKYAIFFCEFGSWFYPKTLTQVCVLNVLFYNTVTLVDLQTGSEATTKIPDLYAIFFFIYS